MKNSKYLYSKFTKIGQDGYLVVPRGLLDAALDFEGEFTPWQAYLYLFVHCAFCDQPGRNALHRGQIAFTAAELAGRFNWGVSRVRTFLHVLQKMGIVKLEMVPGVKSIMTLSYYDALTGGKGNPVKKQGRKEFFLFWKNYYQLLGRDGTDYYRALAEWTRMTQEEQTMAVEHMERYFRSLTDMRFVKAAANYLRCKAFLMPEDVEQLYLNDKLNEQETERKRNGENE